MRNYSIVTFSDVAEKTSQYGFATPISPFPSGQKHLCLLSVPHQSIFQPFWHRRLYQMSNLSRLLGFSPEQQISIIKVVYKSANT